MPETRAMPRSYHEEGELKKVVLCRFLGLPAYSPDHHENLLSCFTHWRVVVVKFARAY